MTHSTTDRYLRAPDAFVRRTPRSLVLLTARARDPIRVSGSAAVVWDMLATATRAADLLSMATDRMSDSSSSVGAELEAALDVLIEAGAVVVVP